MKFGLMVDLGRTNSKITNKQLLEQVTELVEIADKGGFSYVFCGEHHGREMTIAPNPLTLLSYWGGKTKQVRLGSAVVCAPFWHPIKLAGEAALVDVISGGRVDLGIGRGAYPYEFQRMANGISAEEARASLAELLPALRKLWEGDYEHQGEMWSFPSSTATPRPANPTGIPVWVSARHPEVFEMACQNRCNVMVAPLAQPFGEVISLRERLDDAVNKTGNGW